MRILKFRGFHVDDHGTRVIKVMRDGHVCEHRGEWVYGDLVHNKEYACVFPENAKGTFQDYLVIPATVGQNTGKTDPLNQEIYEHDCLGTHLNHVEWGDCGYCINGDTPLSYMCNSVVVGTIFDFVDEENT